MSDAAPNSDAAGTIAESPLSSENKCAENTIAVWSKIVDTQMHFNEMSAKSRQLGLTFVAAALALAVFLFTRNSSDAKYSFELIIKSWHLHLHVAEFVVLAAAAAVVAVKSLDLGVYHKMLRGAVTYGEDFEENFLKKLYPLEKGMTQSISHFSRHSDAKVAPSKGSYVYYGSNHRSAYVKISRFYNIVIFSLIFVSVIMFTVDNLVKR